MSCISNAAIPNSPERPMNVIPAARIGLFRIGHLLLIHLIYSHPTPQVRGGAKRRTLNLLVRLLIPTSQTNAKNVATVAVR